MILFYTNEIDGNTARLTGEEARHCLQVLRHKPGDTIHLIDGVGGRYEGIIVDGNKKSCNIEIISSQKESGKLACHLHLAVAPTKNISRYEWLLEKATEIGISEITPILCRRSERKQIRLDRLQKILLSATKQSMKAYLPKLNPLVPLEEVVMKGEGFIAHCNESSDKAHLWHNYTKGADVTLLIGPEGDFHPKEIEWARNCGMKEVSLGEQRLRTETAAVAAVHIIQLANDVR